MSLVVFLMPASRLLESEAKATCPPFVLMEGPAVVRSGVMPVHAVPQTPLFAREPSGARSKITGRPSAKVGSTAKVKVFDGPPPGAGFDT